MNFFNVAANDVENLSDFVCLGVVFGFIGKFTIQHGE